MTKDRSVDARGYSDMPPREWAANTAGWPAHDMDLANSRANLHSEINARTVSKLKERWTFRLPYTGPYGAFTSNPVIVGGLVYLEDPDSDVFALKPSTGRLLWHHDYHSATPSSGPNAVAYGYGLLFGVTADSAFALEPRTGRQVGIHKLTGIPREGIDMAPQLYDGKLLISTIPGNSTCFYTGGAYGVVYALDAKTGHVLWRFSTVKNPGRMWSNPKANGGGGLWYPPAVDRHGGKLLWYRRVTPHDLRDYDFQDPPILVTERIHGVATEIVVGAGKAGKVIALRAADGKRIWTLAIGKHNRYKYGPLPAKPVVYCPGSLGGVLTPMAEARGVLFVPWIDLCFKGSATGLVRGGPVAPASGGLAGVNPATGAVIWKRTFKRHRHRRGNNCRRRRLHLHRARHHLCPLHTNRPHPLDDWR